MYLFEVHLAQHGTYSQRLRSGDSSRNARSSGRSRHYFLRRRVARPENPWFRLGNEPLVVKQVGER
jgi:hypothetical protein